MVYTQHLKCCPRKRVRVRLPPRPPPVQGTHIFPPIVSSRPLTPKRSDASGSIGRHHLPAMSYAPLAQLVEQLPLKEKVGGSRPSRSIGDGRRGISLFHPEAGPPRAERRRFQVRFLVGGKNRASGEPHSIKIRFNYGARWQIYPVQNAGVAELAYASGLEPDSRKRLGVQISPPAFCTGHAMFII